MTDEAREAAVPVPPRELSDMDRFLALPDHDLAGLVTTAEALEISGRYNASHWRGKMPDSEPARYSIPANPKRDDDIRLSAFIARAERAFRALDRIKEAAGGPDAEGVEVLIELVTVQRMKSLGLGRLAELKAKVDELEGRVRNQKRALGGQDARHALDQGEIAQLREANALLKVQLDLARSPTPGVTPESATP